MAYSINPHFPEARVTALKLLLVDRLPAVVVARKCGIHRSTLWRWKQRWEELNQLVERGNPNRPTRPKSFTAVHYRSLR